MPLPALAAVAVGAKALLAKTGIAAAGKGLFAKLGLGKLGLGKFFGGLFKKAGLKGLFKNPAKLLDTMRDVRQAAQMARQARMTAHAVRGAVQRVR